MCTWCLFDDEIYLCTMMLTIDLQQKGIYHHHAIKSIFKLCNFYMKLSHFIWPRSLVMFFWMVTKQTWLWIILNKNLLPFYQYLLSDMKCKSLKFSFKRCSWDYIFCQEYIVFFLFLFVTCHWNWMP